jgi:hypothetical protein
LNAFDRTTGLGASDAVRIMQGEWAPLWEEKTGRRAPPPLDDIFRVQLGKFTERFHLRWISKRQNIEIQLYDNDDEARLIDPANPWRYVTPDGFDITNGALCEVKHCGSSATVRDRAEYYMPQLQHSLSITGHPWLWFSMIPGNDEPQTVQVDRDDGYIERLLDMERTFWWHVTEKIRPEILPTGKLDAAAAMIGDILVGGYKEDLDFTSSNAWTALALEYSELKGQAARFTEVCVELKGLIPADRRRAFGHGVQIIRDKTGRLSIREHTSP